MPGQAEPEQPSVHSSHSESALDAQSIKSAVTRMSESIMRNPDALMLFSALKARGGYFLDRAMNCSIYLITFTRFLGMEQPEIEKAGMVGMSLDVGMLQIPDAILQKPGPLTPEEIKIVRTHVDLGVKKMQESGMSPEVASTRPSGSVVVVPYQRG